MLLYFKELFQSHSECSMHYFCLYSWYPKSRVLPPFPPRWGRKKKKRKLLGDTKLPRKDNVLGLNLRDREGGKWIWTGVHSGFLRCTYVLRVVLQNALLPAGFRQKDQTAKKASGPFDRERLLAYLEKQALEHKDREDYVPFTKEKKGNNTLACGGGYEIS